MKRKEYTEDEVRVMLLKFRDDVGGVRAMARKIGVTPSYVSDVMLGRRAPGPAFLEAIGIRKEVTTRYVKNS